MKQYQIIITTPVCAEHNSYGLSEGRVQYTSYDFEAFEIWEFNEDYDCETKWTLKYKMNVAEMFPDYPKHRLLFFVEAFHPLNSAVVLLNLYRQKKVLFDMKSKSFVVISLQ
ncbi:hypothetical protein IFM89_000198 [Coptis chinensis]|uniref:Uncharacterized protein n=1 Tax=Coptis chinensis TaxID=261450 RepID=A0A835I6G0_9MAGN|nr:hypothetical protein IFM89_000198 [Coptis chinensis]